MNHSIEVVKRGHKDGTPLCCQRCNVGLHLKPYVHMKSLTSDAAARACMTANTFGQFLRSSYFSLTDPLTAGVRDYMYVDAVPPPPPPPWFLPDVAPLRKASVCRHVGPLMDSRLLRDHTPPLLVGVANTPPFAELENMNGWAPPMPLSLSFTTTTEHPAGNQQQPPLQ